ncbi:MAG TPA: DUF4058 family protein [Pirellulales bacterium]|nr:DUF4058 family protein [Pirellulales bacterium]
MQSPFPGMDPFLEDPAFWPDFHIEFTVALRDTLRRGLPPQYEARLNEQINLIDVSESSHKLIKPDVAVLRAEQETTSPSSVTLLYPAPITLPLLIEEEEHREVWIEVRYRPDRSVVTVVELLSPTNKWHSERAQYLAKRRAILRQNVNFVEIDLLVAGQRMSPPVEVPECDYLVMVARGDRRANCEVYPFSVRQPLPIVAVPLKPPDGDVLVSLSEAFHTAFEHGAYATSIDYSRPPSAPLSKADLEWLKHVRR